MFWRSVSVVMFTSNAQRETPRGTADHQTKRVSREFTNGVRFCGHLLTITHGRRAEHLLVLLWHVKHRRSHNQVLTRH